MDRVLLALNTTKRSFAQLEQYPAYPYQCLAHLCFFNVRNHKYTSAISEAVLVAAADEVACIKTYHIGVSIYHRYQGSSACAPHLLLLPLVEVQTDTTHATNMYHTVHAARKQ